MFELGHFVPKLLAQLLSRTIIGVAIWEWDLFVNVGSERDYGHFLI